MISAHTPEPPRTRLRRLLTPRRLKQAVPHALAAAIALYGGLLRLDAFTGKYGTLEHPAWARFATHSVAPLAGQIRPSSIVWRREQRPYVGGDPINYLAYARGMQSFYQPHVREPVFLAMTRAGLWALDDQDAGVSLASAMGSVLAVFATYLVGAALLSPLAGLLASLGMAIEYDLITWAPDGWRDDAFTAMVLLAAWGLIRLRNRPSLSTALLAGTFCGLACLTRITALSFILPALLWIVAEKSYGSRRERVRFAAISTVILVAIVAPYLISCAIATGDPFLAINYHTGYYRFAEGQSATEPMGVGEYLRTKFANRPVATTDTALNGLFVQPFVTKWSGFEPWMPGLGAALKWLSLGGLAAAPFFAAGRLPLIILLTSLLPYIFTWNLGGGGEWRFTMHAYPFYIVAAVAFLILAVRAARSAVKDRMTMGRRTLRPIASRVAIVMAAAGLGITTYFVLPWFVIREAIAYGESTSVETGGRDLIFYRSGWSRPHREGVTVTVRVSRGERAIVRIPLLAKRDYEIVLRLDPVAPGKQERVSVLFNKQLVGALRLTWNPERVGSYRVLVPERMVRGGSNELAIIPASLVPAGSAGPQFAWLDPGDQAGVRLWYVRVLPTP